MSVEADRLRATLRDVEAALRTVDALPAEFEGWTHAHEQLRELVGDLVGISDYCRRVLAGEQDTVPLEALKHIGSTAHAALARVTSVDVGNPTGGEGP